MIATWVGLGIVVVWTVYNLRQLIKGGDSG